MTNMTLQAVRQLIANDSYAITFQSVEQYRAALLRHFNSLVDGARSYATGGSVPGGLHVVGEGLRPLLVHAEQKSRGTAVTLDEALYALDLVVNKMHVPGLSSQRAFALNVLKRAEAPAAEFANRGQEPDWAGYLKAEGAQQTAAPGALLEILRDVHDTLISESDSDIDHFEDDEEEREGAPVQYAARKVMEVIDLIDAAAASTPGTPEAPAEFERGYFCAVSTLLNEDGDSTYARSVFKQGGDPPKADPLDIERFVTHGLMDHAATQKGSA